jgi:hypothetical protein
MAKIYINRHTDDPFFMCRIDVAVTANRLAFVLALSGVKSKRGYILEAFKNHVKDHGCDACEAWDEDKISCDKNEVKQRLKTAMDIVKCEFPELFQHKVSA